MKSTRTDGFVRDERGQAIVESVIVVPVVLFVFIAMVQFILYANVAQLGNLAAYGAARSMSVHLSAGQGDAVRFAKLAGAVAYAPLSQPAPGEIAHYIDGPIGSEPLNIANFLRNEMGLETEAIEKFAGIQIMGPEGLEGPAPDIPSINDQDPEELRGMYALYTALGRLKFVEGQALDFAVRNIGGPELQEVNVELHYEYPMYIPGFTELWNYLPGETTGEAVDVTPLHQALGGAFTVVVKTKASMGIEHWSGVVVTEDGRTADAPPPSGEGGSDIAETAQEIAEIGNEIEQKAEEIEQLEEEKEQLEQERDDCIADADNDAEVLACNVEYNPQINAKQSEIDDLGEEVEDLNDEMEDLQNQAAGEAVDAVEEGLDNLTAALNCD